MKLKKIAALSLTTALALTMVACGGSGTNSNGATSSDCCTFNNISVNGVSISVDGNISINNGKVFVNGKELEQPENKEEQKWKVPKGIKINKITTDMTIISDYDIEIDGNGKLEKKISLL